MDKSVTLRSLDINELSISNSISYFSFFLNKSVPFNVYDLLEDFTILMSTFIG